MQMNLKKKCVVCDQLTPNRIVHKETKKEYPLCSNCKNNSYYNSEIFDFNEYREINIKEYFYLEVK